MKKKLTIFVVALLCLMLAVLGTAAYFTQSVTIHNVITSGNVDIELVELTAEDGPEFEDITNAMAGNVYGKVVMAENTGKGDAWIRVKLETSVTPAEGAEAELGLDMVTLDINSTNWTERDGWYYYNNALTPGLRSEPLISTVTLGTDMGNEWQKAKIIVDVYMQATQVANNGTSALDAGGWPIFKTK